MASAAALNLVSPSSSSSERVSSFCIAASALFCSIRTCRCFAISEPVYVGPMGRVLVGCSGWQYASWREALYPKGCPQREWLTVYARTFPTAEDRGSFYPLPKREPAAHCGQQAGGR